MNSDSHENCPAVLIGPTYPYKGGIAQYASLLFGRLAATRPVVMHSYHSLYPSWLFPGRSEADSSQQPLTVPGVKRDLHFTNPLTFFLLGRQLRRTPCRIIVTWWTIAWAPHTWLLARAVRSSCQLVFWCHNVVDHDAGIVKRIVTRCVLRQANAFVVHNEGDRDIVLRWFPKARVALSALPLLEAWPERNPPAVAQPSQRDGRPARLLFFGFIRPYKGVADLLEALGIVCRSRPVELTVAGEFWGRTRADTDRLISRLGLTDCVTIVDRYVPNEEIPGLFERCDLVVLPYREATGSAVGNLGVEMERPLVVTRVGSLPACVEQGKNGFVTNPADPAALAAHILKALETPFDPRDLAAVRRNRRDDWSRLVAALDSVG